MEEGEKRDFLELIHLDLELDLEQDLELELHENNHWCISHTRTLNIINTSCSQLCPTPCLAPSICDRALYVLFHNTTYGN